MKLTILNIASHRNGIDGAPFHAIVFRDKGSEGSVKLGIVFETPRHTAVLDIAQLAEHDVAFSSNSRRGDRYEPSLRRQIARSEQAAVDKTTHPLGFAGIAMIAPLTTGSTTTTEQKGNL